MVVLSDAGEPDPARGFGQIGTARNRALVAVDPDDLAICRRQDRARVTAGTERAVDIGAAIADIERLQRRGAELASPNYIPYGLAFDIDKLSFELNFFVMHFIEAHRQATLTAADRDAASMRRTAESGCSARRCVSGRSNPASRGRLKTSHF